ncbi:unnamed protein product, partial [Amoebophrya sp. A25]
RPCCLETEGALTFDLNPGTESVSPSLDSNHQEEHRYTKMHQETVDLNHHTVQQDGLLSGEREQVVSPPEPDGYKALVHVQQSKLFLEAPFFLDFEDAQVLHEPVCVN